MLEGCVFSHVGCLSLLGFDEIFEAVFEAGRSLTEKAELERKRLWNIYIFVGLTAGNQNVREREKESVCCLCKSQCKRVCTVSVSQNGESESVLSL